MGSFDARYVVGEFSCSTANASPVAAPVVTVTPAENAIAKEIRARATVRNRDGIIRAVAWLQPLLEKWMEKLRGYHKIGETAVMPGAKLADLVAKHMRTVFIEHRKAVGE